MGDLLVRMRRPLVCAGLAAGLATTLVVTTPNSAEALLPLLAVPAVASIGGAGAVSGATVAGAAAMLGLVGAANWIMAEQPWSDEIDETPSPWGPAPWLTEMFGQSQDVSIPIQEELPFPPEALMSPQDPYSEKGEKAAAPTNVGAKFELMSAVIATGGANINYVVKAHALGGPTSGIQYHTPIVETTVSCRDSAGTVTETYFDARVLANSTSSGWAVEGGRPGTLTGCPSASAIQWMEIGAPAQPAFQREYDALKAKGSAQWAAPVKNKVTVYAPGYQKTQQGYMVGVECVHPTTLKRTTIYMPTPAGAGHLGIPSCHAAGVGTVAERIFTDFLEGGRTRQPAWEIRPSRTITELAQQGDTSWTDCDPGFGPICRMEVYIDGKLCKKLAPECLDWLERTTVNPGSVECKYGGRTVHVSYCYGMESYYKGSPVVASQLNADGNPATSDPRAPYVPEVDPDKNDWKVPVEVPYEGPSTDPDTYVPPEVDVSNPLPEAPVEPAPETPTDPGGNPSTPPYEPPGPVVNPPVAPPGTATSCWSGSAAWNPIEWVYSPVVCAMRAVFEPTRPIDARVNAMSAQFSNKVPVSWFGVGTEGISGGTCPTSWKIDYRGESFSLICGTAADSIVQAFRPVLGAMLVIAAIFPLIRSLFYAAIPLFKVTPS